MSRRCPRCKKEMSCPRHILEIDDNYTHLSLTRHILHQAGFAVSTACDGAEGLDLTQTQQPDLIVLDVVMPGLNGLEVCQRLKEDPATSQIPVLLYSSLESHNMPDSHTVGADALLRKPAAAAVLHRLFVCRIGRAMQINERHYVTKDAVKAVRNA